MLRCFLVLLALTVGSAAQAQRVALPADTLYAADYDAFTFVAPPAGSAQRGAARARFELDLRGFPPEAEAAFAFAASIWESHIESAVPIRVRADFAELDVETLGAAGPACVEARPELPVRNTWYAVALAEAILGQDLNPPGADVCPGVDITATFNRNIDWYFGTDGNTPRGTYDFATVVLHELGHGLGFFGSFAVVTVDENACPESLGEVGVGEGCWGFGSDALRPLIFDRFAEDARGVSLLDTEVYPNPSPALGSALRSDAVFFDGPTATASNATVPVDLFAPSSFEPGSSFSHLDEAVSPAGDANSLMTPFLARAEAIFSPGPFTCGIFRDIGWPLGEDCLALLDVSLVAFSARTAEGSIELTFQLADNTGIVQAVVEQEVRRGAAPGEAAPDFQPLAVPLPALDPEEGQVYTVTLPGPLAPGIYTFRLLLIRADGSSFLSDREKVPVTVAVVERGVTVNVFPNPFTDFAAVEVLVGADLIGGDRGVEIAVYDVLGRRVALLFEGNIAVNDGERRILDGSGLAAGVYFVRVVGEKFETTRTVTRVR